MNDPRFIIDDYAHTYYSDFGTPEYRFWIYGFESSTSYLLSYLSSDTPNVSKAKVFP
jgi:hypothetical protein